MKLVLPRSVQWILETLAAHGFEAYAVGGCVRDAVLGRKPDDWDITTSARPQQIKAVFPRTVDTGIAHGTVTVLHGGNGYEVTTYRIDGEYEDSRHPKEVAFTASLEEDLKRRDFTINAMAYNEETGLVDAFGGMEDLKKRRICCVGAAEERFGEDALRILRGARFAAQLGFTLEPETKAAMKKLAPTLSHISAERIQAELSKLLLSHYPEQIDDLEEYGIAPVIFPEYSGLSSGKRREITAQLKRLEAAESGSRQGVRESGSYREASPRLEASESGSRREASPRLGAAESGSRREISPRRRNPEREKEEKCEKLSVRWAAVLQFFTEEQAGAVLRRFKYDNKTLRYVKGILEFREKPEEADPVYIRKALCAMGEPLFSMVLKFRYSRAEKKEEFEKISHMLEIEREILDRGECVSLKDLAVTGRDLMEAGCPKGRQIGRILEELLEIVLEDPAKNEKGCLLGEAEKRLRRGKQL